MLDVAHLSAPLTRFGTSTVSDALDRLGIPGQLAGIRRLSPGEVVAGPAFTVAYQPVDASGGTVGDFLDDVVPGSVVVIDNQGRTDCTVWGDLMTLLASRRGVNATVINGVCRDTARIAELRYPMFSAGLWMRTGKDRVTLVATQVPVSLGQVRVHPGDIMVGDDDGVVAVPAARAQEVLEVATQIESAEAAIRDSVLNGSRLDEARVQAGYHALQTPPAEARP